VTRPSVITFDCYRTLIDFDLEGAVRSIAGDRIRDVGVDEDVFEDPDGGAIVAAGADQCRAELERDFGLAHRLGRQPQRPLQGGKALGDRQVCLGTAELDQYLEPVIGGRRLGESPAQIRDGRLGCAARERLAAGRAQRVDHPGVPVGLRAEEMRGDPVRRRAIRQQRPRRGSVQRRAPGARQLRGHGLVDDRMHEHERRTGREQLRRAQAIGRGFGRSRCRPPSVAA
jgi:hypothetical protein